MVNQPLQKKEILIVDDESHIVTLLSTALELNGYELRVANNGVEALKCVKVKHPDLILLDVKMPLMDGWTVCQKLKSDDHTKKIPIIIVTAYGQNESREKSFHLGADDFITKPFDIKMVLDRIGQLLKTD